MHNTLRLLLTFLFIMLVMDERADAYIDAGTGGLFYQLIILVIGVIGGYLAFFKKFIKRIFTRKKDLDNEDK